MNKLERNKSNVMKECLRQQKCGGKSVAGGVVQGSRSRKLAMVKRAELGCVCVCVRSHAG